MKKTSSTAILKNIWMILALAMALTLFLSVNWYYFRNVRERLDIEFSIRLRSLAALVSASLDPEAFTDLAPLSPEGTDVKNRLRKIADDFDLSNILVVREDGVILLSLDDSLFPPGENYPLWNMDFETIVSALEGTPSSTGLVMSQEGSWFKAGYSPLPAGSTEARAVAAVEADASFMLGLSDIRDMLTAASIVSIIGLIVFIGFVIKATSSLLWARESLMRADTLASMGRMAAGIAHEIRNPLFIIRGAAEKLQALHPESSKEIDTFIIEETDRLDSILTAYLQFAREEKAPMSEGDLAVILSRSVRLINEGGKGGGLPIRSDIELTKAPLICDEKKLQQALMNILLNSSQFSTDSSESIEVSLSHEGKSYNLVIRDHGPGIPAGEIEKVFEPFYTTRNDGSGLGLSIARRIVDDHGGSLDISNAKGSGTTVRVVLPAIQHQREG
ncbi:MAG: hypothetical protein KOO63_15040 [Bacteroidales bacterium]|nr:hypothetical protein [Candidatus Latescibacterota bacterium]